MPKRKPSQRRHPEKTPQQPRDRLAEIRAEIQAAQQQIETKRRDGRVIRTAEDFESLERAIAALTNRLSALLMAEATQVALDDSRRLGVKPDQVNELVDFYHAVEHLGKIAALQRRWTAAERQAWIGRQRRRLRKGGAEDK